MTGPARTVGILDPAYTPDRIRRLRTVLWVVVGFALVLLLLDLATVASVGLDEDGATAFAVLLGGVALVLLASAGTALRLLPRPGVGARRATVVTGTALLVLALPMAVTWIGFVMVPIGLVVLLLALLPDTDPDEPPARDDGRGDRRGDGRGRR